MNLKYFFLLIPLTTLLTSSLAPAETKCFLVKENNTMRCHDGEATKRYSPCSTFKIAISLMGYEEGILVDEKHPQVAYEEKYGPCFLEVWKQPQDPISWIQNSCVWYSQWITPQLGEKKFADYVQKFHYGNEDVSGDPGKNNGLTRCWLSSSLKISPEEQLAFLEKLTTFQLPVSRRAQEMTQKILFIEKLPHGWKLYGKTGSGYQLKPDGSLNEDLKTGWFVGWVEKGDRKILFVHYLEDKEKNAAYGGLRAKGEAKEKLAVFLTEKE